MARKAPIAEAWTWEIVSVAGSALILAALVGILVVYDGQPIFTWHGVTLNAIVSVLSTASKAALLFAIQELVSQWKWILFTDRSRPLMDFERIDSASRGLFGSFQLMWNCRKTTILRIGALVILLDVAIDPFAQQLVQYKQYPVYTPDPETTVSRASRYSKGSEYNMQLAMIDPSAVNPNQTNVHADADYSMQSAILYGLAQPLASVTQQSAFKCATGNCTWPAYESLAICNICTNLDDQLERLTTNGALYVSLETDNGAASATKDGGTSFRLPNGLFIDNANGWVYNDSINEGANDGLYGAVMMTTFGTGNASETASMQDLDTLIWALSVIRTTADPANASAAWPDLPHSAMECALYYCVNSYETAVVEGVLQENATQAQDAVRVGESWQPEDWTGDALGAEVLSSIDFSSYFSAIPRTDLAMVSKNTQFNVSQTAVDSISSYFHMSFSTDLQEFNITDDDDPAQGKLNGFYMTSGQVQYQPSSMQVFFSAANLSATFTSLAASMSNALRDGADAGDKQLAGARGVLTTFYDIQWPWISLHAAVLLMGVLFFTLTLMRNREAPVWKSSSLAVMARGYQVQDIVQGLEVLRDIEGKARVSRIMLIEKSPVKEEDATEYDPLESPYSR